MPNTLCLIVNHENVNACAYQGNDRSMLITNSLFRIGGAAALLSNRLQFLGILCKGLSDSLIRSGDSTAILVGFCEGFASYTSPWPLCFFQLPSSTRFTVGIHELLPRKVGFHRLDSPRLLQG